MRTGGRKAPLFQREHRMKRKTNVQIVKDIMENSRYGALAQVFVMDALHKFSDAVAESELKDYPPGSFVAPEAWIGVAKEIKNKLERTDENPQLVKAVRDDNDDVPEQIEKRGF